MRSLILAVLLTLLLAACGDSTAPGSSAGSGDPAARYRATGMVMEKADGDPELCLGAVADSYPPQCDGPAIIGWDWDAVDGEESASGVTWGSYTVVGTWDGDRFTLTEPARPPEPAETPGADEDRFASPCPPPPGGWRPMDASRATDEAMQAAIDYARSQPEFAGLWVDQSPNPAHEQDRPDEGAMNDPALLVLNARFTDELATHEAGMRQHWGGALCVSQARHTQAELEAIRDELHAELDRVMHSSIDEVRGVVEIGVFVADEALRRRIEERYGEGVVKLDAALRPVEDEATGS